MNRSVAFQTFISETKNSENFSPDATKLDVMFLAFVAFALIVCYLSRVNRYGTDCTVFTLNKK